MSKSKDAGAQQAVLDYLVKQNRPYSAMDIFNNLHKAFGKTAIVKVLESLSHGGQIKEKVYGKQKVYVADQGIHPDVDESELKAMDDKIKKLGEKLNVVNSQVKKQDGELRSFSSALSTDEAKESLKEVSEKCTHCSKKITSLKSNQHSVSPEERENIIKNRTKYVKEWRKRKRMTNDILNAILEGYPKSKKQLYDEIGIETDEEYKVKPPDL